MNILESASPWMKGEELKTSINPEDFKVGFEFEFIINGTDEDDNTRIDEIAYNEAINNTVDSISYEGNYFDLLPSKISSIVDEDDFNNFAPSQDEDEAKIDLPYLSFHMPYFEEKIIPVIFPAGNTYLKLWLNAWDSIDEVDFSTKLEELIGVGVELDYEIYSGICNNYFEISQKYLLAEDHEMSNFLNIICLEDENGRKFKTQLFEKLYDICNNKIEDYKLEQAKEYIDIDDYKVNDGGSIKENAYNRIKAEMQENRIASYDDIELYTKYINTGDGWAIKDDTSIKDANEGDWSVEVSTPAFDLETGLDIFNRMMRLISRVGYTNETTGLHISIDEVNNSKEDQNWLKMAVLFNDMYFTKQFGRENNQHNDSLLRFFTNLDSSQYIVGNSINYEKIEEDFKKEYGGKNSSRNVSINMTNDKYYEFRVSGGENYETMRSQIISNIYKFCELIRISSTDEYDKEYKNKLNSLLFRQGNSKKSQIESNKEFFNNIIQGDHSVTSYTKFIQNSVSLPLDSTVISRMKYIAKTGDASTFEYVFNTIIVKNLNSTNLDLVKCVKLGFDYKNNIFTIYNTVNDMARLNVIKFMLKLDLHTLTNNRNIETSRTYDGIINYLLANQNDPEVIKFININEDILRNELKGQGETPNKIKNELGINN